MLVGAIMIFVLVMTLFLLVMLRPGTGRGFPIQSWIVAGGVIFPSVVLAALIFYGLIKGEYLLHGEEGSSMVEVEARSRMWQWEFLYPDGGGVRSSPGILHIPVGQVIEVTATSEDVIHSFWVPRLGGKIDAIPGHGAKVRILADQPGVYGGVCAEYCGTGHAGMRFEVQAHGPEDYQRVIDELPLSVTRDEQ